MDKNAYEFLKRVNEGKATFKERNIAKIIAKKKRKGQKFHAPGTRPKDKQA